MKFVEQYDNQAHFSFFAHGLVMKVNVGGSTHYTQSILEKKG